MSHTHNRLAYLWDSGAAPTHPGLNHAQHALDLYQVTGNQHGQSHAYNTFGWLHALLGDHHRALGYCQKALTLFQELDNCVGQAYMSVGLGYAHHHLGDQTQALTCYQHALTLLRDLGDRYHEAATLSCIGDTPPGHRQPPSRPRRLATGADHYQRPQPPCRRPAPHQTRHPRYSSWLPG